MNSTKRKFNSSVLLFLVLTGIAALLYYLFPSSVLLSLLITLSTVSYHLAMRLSVGFVFNKVLHNRISCRNKHLSLPSWEKRLYRIIKVQKWKGRLPIYDSESFKIEKHSLEELKGAMYQAELVHKACALLSFLPLLAAVMFGSFFVFFFTSLFAAGIDFVFVIVQRYNRARISAFEERKNRAGALRIIEN